MPVARGAGTFQRLVLLDFRRNTMKGRQRLLDLYQRDKDKQWDAAKRID
jgi:hypothetical protein